MYFYIQYNKYIYICTCVCVCGGGCLKMRCPFFLSKNPFWNQKKTPRFETYPCIYNIFICWHVFFVSILCWFVPSKKYVFWFSFVCSFFSIILSEKCIKSKNVSLEIAIKIDFLYIKKTKCPQKRVPKQVIHINNL